MQTTQHQVQPNLFILDLRQCFRNYLCINSECLKSYSWNKSKLYTCAQSNNKICKSLEPTLTNRSHTQFQTKPIHHSPDTYRFRWGHSRTSVFTYLQTTLESVHTEVPLQTKPIHCCPDTDSFRVYSYLVPWAGTKATHSCPHTYNIVSGSVLTKSLQHTDEHQTDSFQISSHGKSFQTFSYQVSYCGNQTIHKLTTQ